MHHLYPLSKGDQLCPLGFHPQVRWPTRCKRCFRDYKEHGSRRGVDDLAISSPNLSDNYNSKPSNRTWTSTQNLATVDNGSTNDIELRKRPQSWTSTPDLDEPITGKVSNQEVSVSIQIPQRRHTTALDKEIEETITLRRPPLPPSTITTGSSVNNNTELLSKTVPEDLTILKSDSLAERVRKMNLLKKQRSLSRERSLPKETLSDDTEKNLQTHATKKSSVETENTKKKTVGTKTTSSTSTSSTFLLPSSSSSRSSSPSSKTLSSRPRSPQSNSLDISLTSSNNKPSTSSSSSSTSNSMLKISSQQMEGITSKKVSDVQLVIPTKSKINSSKDNENSPNMTKRRETTEDNKIQNEMKSLRAEFDAMKTRAERAEREKSDLLLRRLASADTAPNRTAASEALKLQHKVNEMQTQLEDLKDEKRTQSVKIRQLEHDLNVRPAKSIEDELRRKLQAAEQLCEELMDENEYVKKELRGMEQEIDEMHDGFREDRADELNNLRKDLTSTTKNCRILSFKLKKSERKIEQLEQDKMLQGNADLVTKVRKMEEELKFANELAKQLQSEAEEQKNPGKKKTPKLGVVGKSMSADGKYSRESLTRGGSQEDPQQLLRDLQDSMERESDLKEQLKFAEEEAENLRKKVTRFEDENESLMMQLKKMASRSRSRKLSPIPNRLTPEPPADRDEGISDEDDPAELRILLELNEQESSLLRIKVEDLEKENIDYKKQIQELQEKMKGTGSSSGKFSSFLSLNSSNNQSDRKLKILEDELSQLRKTIIDKDRSIERLQAEITAAKKNSDKTPLRIGIQDGTVDIKRQLSLVEQEASILRSKISALEHENEKLQLENKKLQLQASRKTPTNNGTLSNSAEVMKIQDSLSALQKEYDNLKLKHHQVLQDAEEKLLPRTPKRFTDLTPKSHLKKWVEELEEEIKEMRVTVLNSGGEKLKNIETEKMALEKELQSVNEKLITLESDYKKLKASKDTSSVLSAKLTDFEIKYKKSEEEGKKLNAKIKDLDDKIKKQDSQIKQTETAKTLFESQTKRDKEKLATLEKDYEKERKERERWESKVSDLDDEIVTYKKSAEKTKILLEKEIKDLKTKLSNFKSEPASSKQFLEQKKYIEELQADLNKELKRYSELNGRFESLTEENILTKAQLATQIQNLQSELNSTKLKLAELDKIKLEKSELSKNLKHTQKRLNDAELQTARQSSNEHEKTMLKNSIIEKDQEYDRLRRENEMNVEIVFQLRKDNDELNSKLNDFNRISRAKSSINDHNISLENEIKSLKIRLENSEINCKSEVASTRLRYEQQVKNLSAEINSMQRQCERFKKDRDSVKQLLGSAQKKIADLKQSNTGRLSRGSMHSSDNDDDKGKIMHLEQQVGNLEDQLCEARLEASKMKTELISERSANEIKISEMQSKLNVFEEDRVIGSGRTKIPGLKTKLELSWQKEREDQQRLLQETSTLARDLRQTLFEVERERDKERLEVKRKLEQQKRGNEEELEESRKKIAELQCDLLELRDIHAKIRTSNEKLRRERERYERELIKRRLEHDGGERKVGALLQTVDELVKIAPNLKMATSIDNISTGSTAKPKKIEHDSNLISLNNSQISNVLARLAEASEELRKFQRLNEDEIERTRLRRNNLRRATSQENDSIGTNAGLRTPILRVARSSGHNGSLYRKSLSLDHSIQQDQSIWKQEDGSMSSMQSIESEMGGFGRDSSIDSRLSGGSTQSDIPRGPRKKKKGFMGKLRSLTKSGKNSESEISIQGSDSDVSVASDRLRSSKKDLRGRLSNMFKRSGSTSRGGSTERMDSLQRPVAVTIVGTEDGPLPRAPPPLNTTKPIKSISKPPTATSTTPLTTRRLGK